MSDTRLMIEQMRQDLYELRQEVQARPFESGGASAEKDIWKITAGSTLAVGIEGAARQEVDLETHTVALVPDLIAPTGLDDGVLVAQNVSTGQLSLLWCGNPSLMLNDLWLNDHVLCYDTLTFPITDDVENSQTFLTPAFLL